MNDEQMLRYARHIMLDGFGFEAQTKLLESRVLIIGLGGLGSAALAYLASAGVGQLDLVDYDQVELSNLQRQIAHTTESIGEQKVVSAARFARALNPDLQINTINKKVGEQELQTLIAQADLVLDCTDNATIRQQINAVCLQTSTAWVSGAAIKFSGQITCFDFRHQPSPCYACLYSPDDAMPVDNCATLGVFAPLLGIIGSMQAAEAIKMLTGVGQSMHGKVMLLDAKSMQWQTLKLPPNPSCPVCGGGSLRAG